MVAGLATALAVLVALAIGLAVRQYNDAQRMALHNIRACVVLAAAVLDTYFGGEIAAWSAVAQAPAVVPANQPAIAHYFQLLQPPGSKIFPVGLEWIDRRGFTRVSGSPQPVPSLNVTDRAYFRTVMATGRPYVSDALIARRGGQEVIVIAVPTRDAGGRLSGELAASILAGRLADALRLVGAAGGSAARSGAGPRRRQDWCRRPGPAQAAPVDTRRIRVGQVAREPRRADRA